MIRFVQISNSLLPYTSLNTRNKENRASNGRDHRSNLLMSKFYRCGNQEPEYRDQAAAEPELDA